jgi:hypothetical protein
VDISLSDFWCLKYFWADKAIEAMSAGSIVIHFYVSKHRLFRCCSRDETFTVNGFNFERMKKALSIGIIVAIHLTEAVLGKCTSNIDSLNHGAR